MRADMIDVEHRPCGFVSIRFHPRNDRGIDLRDLGIASLIGTARHRHLRQSAELHMFRIGIAALHGLPRHHFYVFFFVLSVEVSHCTEAGIILQKIHPPGFLRQLAPDHSLVLVAGNRHLYGCGIALGNGLDDNVVTHVFFLSQPFPGCVQKRQFVFRILQCSLQFLPPGREELLQLLPVIIDLKNSDDIGKGETHLLQSGDAPRCRKLIFPVIPVIREAVDFRRFQKADFIIVAEHPDADPGQL